jgi:hypothetical protein
LSQAPTTRVPHLAGGCQCGAIRFAVYAEPPKIGLCHCRMCQKAVAGPFAVLAEVPWGDFAWTRGTPSTFRSSSRALRDFCSACGTPLRYRHPNGPVIELLTGAFDEPSRVAPTYEVGAESKLAWLRSRASFPSKSTVENSGAARLAGLVSYQHPDHDTASDWSAPPPPPAA